MPWYQDRVVKCTSGLLQIIFKFSSHYNNININKFPLYFLSLFGGRERAVIFASSKDLTTEMCWHMHIMSHQIKNLRTCIPV